MAHAARFWDRIADRYAARPVDDPESYETKLARTETYLRPEMDVLEVGCGTGTTALHHAGSVRHIDAVDVSARMIDIAREKARAAGVGNVDFSVGALDDLEMNPARYDIVMAHSLLHLLADRPAALARFHDLLKPGGYFISSTTCISGGLALVLGVVLPVLRVLRVLGGLPLVRFFTPDRLVGEVEAAGFQIDHRWQPGPRKAVYLVARKA